MTPITFILYKVYERYGIFLIYSLYCYIATQIQMHSNNVRHGRFYTNGIPIIEVPRKNGGKIMGTIL